MPKAVKLSTIKPDPRNANKGTKAGRKALNESIRDLGFGRSILLDSEGVAIAGNKTMEAALAANPDQKVRIIETDGTELIAVKRTDITLGKGGVAQRLAIADNRVSELDLSWDQDVLAAIASEVDLGSLFGDSSPTQQAGDMAVPESAYKEQFGVIILLTNAKEQEAMFTRLQAEGLTVRVVTT